MAFDTAFNITWNQRVNKEETAYLKFLDSRKQKPDADPSASLRKSERRPKKALSDADLMSAVRSVRSDSDAGGQKGGLRRTRGSSSVCSSSVLQKAGSSVSSPSAGGRGKRAPPMTFEQMQENVFNQYMNRYIQDLEKEAKDAAQEQEWQKQKIKDGMQQQIDEKAKARQLERENARQVQEQIEENKQRRANTRKNFVEAASAHNFPLFTETFISQEEVDQYRKDVKQNFRKELEVQQRTQDTMKNIILKKDRIYAAEKMATNIKKMQDDHARDHEVKLQKGNDMMRVWDRDIRLKNIKNAILSGKDATKEMGISSS